MNNWSDVEDLAPHCSVCPTARPDGWNKSSEMMRDSAVNQAFLPQISSTLPLNFSAVCLTFPRPQSNPSFSLCCEASIVVSLPSVYLLNIWSDRQALKAASQLSHFVTQRHSALVICVGVLCVLAALLSTQTERCWRGTLHMSGRKRRKLCWSGAWSCGAPTRSVSATMACAERHEGHRGHFLPVVLLLV